MTCFVPNCNNSIGVPFPEDVNLKKQWLVSLRISNEPTENSFVCLDHFRGSDIQKCDANEDGLEDIYASNVRRSVILKKGAIPILWTDIKEKEENYTCTDDFHICRVCNGTENLEKSIFDTVETGTTIMSMIMLCCYPIVITKSDDLPKLICANCLRQLHKSYKFRSRCLRTNVLWNDKKKVELKRKESDQIGGETKRTCLEEDRTTDDLASMLSNKRNDHYSIEETIKIESQTTHQEKSIIDEPSLVTVKTLNYDQIEEELEKMYGTKSESATLSNAVKAPSSKSERNSQAITKISVLIPKVTLPRCIRVTNTTKNNYQSDIGVFHCIYMKGPQNSIFTIADDYLFTFGLYKGNMRYLRCVVPSCKAKGEQLISEEENLTFVLKIPHNHEKPCEESRKKQMFFYIMRKRMQLDKSLNIRVIYEDICEQEPEIRKLVPLRNIINEICKHQVTGKLPSVSSFEDFYNRIEDDIFERLHFTSENLQFYQERFATDDGGLAIVFCNIDVMDHVSVSNLMYVDASFSINNSENFGYQLVTVLVWIEESYYPVLFALVNKKSQEIFCKIFQHLRDVLAPNLRPHEIVTDYEASLYYALGETYLESHIGGSVYYYTQNLYKKVCCLELARVLETNSNFRNIYHMMLMLPLLPVNTIDDAFNTIKAQARDLGLWELASPLFDHITEEWIGNVTPEIFCVHRLENRINENVIAPFKKFRDFLLLCKGKMNQSDIRIAQVVEKLIELESFIQGIYAKGDKKSFSRDLSSFQKKNVLKAWQYIEAHPKININNFFQKVLGYIKCMENQLWIWGFYGYKGDSDDVLISASNFINPDEQVTEDYDHDYDHVAYIEEDCPDGDLIEENSTLVVEAVIDNEGEVVLQTNDDDESTNALIRHVRTYVRYK